VGRFRKVIDFPSTAARTKNEFGNLVRTAEQIIRETGFM
jgi:hypothetical protein